MDYHSRRFKWSLQALAAPPDVQLGLYPNAVFKVDELAINFDQYYEVIKLREGFFAKEQGVLLEELNRQLEAISGPENAHYWTEEALRTDSVWERIRSLARAALHALGWSTEVHPKRFTDILIRNA